MLTKKRKNNKYIFFTNSKSFLFIFPSLDYNKTFPIQMIYKRVLFQYVPFEI